MWIIKYETIKLNAIREFHNGAGGNHKGLIGLGGNDGRFLALYAAISGERPADPVSILKDWIDKFDISQELLAAS